jgi:hypothetical protein
MRRRQWIELEDLPWFPKVLRDGGTAFLTLAARLTRQDEAFVELIERTLRHTGGDSVVDLCSGGGGPAVVVSKILARRGFPVRTVLTDLYPNVSALRHAAAATAVEVSLESVNALDVPDGLTGMRTLFNAFHHFTPQDSRAILENAVRRRQPIGVFEAVHRDIPMLLVLALLPLVVLLTVPFWRPFRPAWLFWTWVIPVLPAFILWDGVASWRRIYSLPELRELVDSIEAPEWTWEMGIVPLAHGPGKGTWLVGYPHRSAGEGSQAAAGN